MGNDLNGLSKVIAAPLALDHMLVDLAGGDVVVFRQGHVEVSLVVPQVEVDLSAVIQHEHLSVSVAIRRCSRKG